MTLRRAATGVGFTMSVFLALCLCIASPDVAAAAEASPVGGESWCGAVSPGVTAGAVGAPDLTELSGLAASRAHPGLLWANNDSGDTARLFAMSDVGAPLGIFAVAGAEAIDWEDIAVGPGPDPVRSYIYIGDIGDNGSARDHVTVYRVPEPAAAPGGADTTLEGAEALHLAYPDGPEDAEALFVDPITGDLFIVTKQLSGVSKVLAVAAADLRPPDAPGADVPVMMTLAGSIFIEAAAPSDPGPSDPGPTDPGPTDPGPSAPALPIALPSTMATAADITPDGRVILVRTYQQVLAFERAEGQSVGEAMSAAPCSAPQVAEAQGEAIAFSSAGDRYFTAGETQLAVSQGALAADAPNPLTSFAISPPAPTVAPTTVAPDTTTTQPSTTQLPTTQLPTTQLPTTAAEAAVPTTVTTESPVTADPATGDLTTTDSGSTAARPGSARSGSDRWWIVGASALVIVGAILLLLTRLRRRPAAR